MPYPTPVNSEEAAKYAIYAMAASNSYRTRKRFHLEKIGWEEIMFKKHFFLGLAYLVYQHTETKEIIWAFRGSNSIKDYLTGNLAIFPWFNQYKKARKVVRKFVLKNQPKNITVCGHSLGGGLALCISVRQGIPAIGINSSPRIFDGLGDNHKSAERILIYEDGEILEKLRKIHPKAKKAVPKENTYVTTYDFQGSQHNGYKLANSMAKHGSQIDSSLSLLVHN